MQELYEKKLVTYPRTDARVLSTAVAKEITRNLNGLSKYPMAGPYLKDILGFGSYKDLAKTRYVNDKQIIQSELSESFVTADGWRNIPEFEVTAGDYVRVILEGKNAEKRSVHITPNIEYLDIDAENSSPVIELKEKDVLAFGVEKSQ